MSMSRLIKVVIVLSALVVFSVAGVLAASAQEDNHEVLTFDVAEDTSRFVFDEAPVFEEDGFPAYGNSFVTQGYIYPEGTLDGTNGVLPDGSPEFPELVIGEWTCMGFFVGDGAHTESGPWVITTQFYNFGEAYGNQTLVTQGYEVADLDVPIARAISGGTGDYSTARGEASQTLLGFNAVEGVVLRFDVNIENN